MLTDLKLSRLIPIDSESAVNFSKRFVTRQTRQLVSCTPNFIVQCRPRDQ